MAQWRIKEIGDLTKVSVRMLHHYDKIGLLKPSVRASNGYRWYSEQDLAKLQQIVALKYFGFGLRQIKTMLLQGPDIYEHLLAQERMLIEQSENLRKALDALCTILKRYKESNSLDWNDLVKLIERYSMADELKNTWFDLLSEEQKKRYITFKQAYPKEIGDWEKSIVSINSLKIGDPEGPDGENAVKVFLKAQNAIIMWEETTKKATKKMTQADATELLKYIDKCLTKGQPFSQDGAVWFAKAQIAYRLRSWDGIYEEITKNLDADPESAVGKKLAEKWRDIISEHCVGGSKEFFFGMKLLMESAKAKVQMQNVAGTTTEQNQQQMKQDLKMLLDPMAISWIEKALKAN